MSLHHYQPKTCSNQEISVLLPWYVNNTLDIANKKFISTHIRHCSVCQHELEMLYLLEKQVSEAPMPQSSTKQSWGRLLTTLADRETSKQDVTTIPNTGIKKQLSVNGEWLSTLYRPIRMVAMIALLTAPIGWHFFNQITAPQFHTLSNRAPTKTAEDADLRLVFDNTLDVEQIDRLLGEYNARRLGDAGLGGIYNVRLPEHRRNMPSQKELIAILRQQEDILLVEPFIKP